MTGEPRRAWRIQVSGRVQGVGFRWFTRRAAEQLGLAGRVRNLPDGRVEIEVAGSPERLEAFRSQVSGLAEQELQHVPAWEGFVIDR
jgi:acylphosphatase